MSRKKIQSALISVYHKDHLEPLLKLLDDQHVTIYSTGGTQKFIKELGIEVTAVESVTGYPSIFGGRVKTLHPKILGGILSRRGYEGDRKELAEFQVPEIDLVVIDLYPFEETVAAGAGEEDIIEKIDIGGISLIRAAAKNYKDVVIVSSREQYGHLQRLLEEKQGCTDLEDRRFLATQAFQTTSHYDTAIFNYFNRNTGIRALKISENRVRTLRYGENPHQQGAFYGGLDKLFEQLNGKELSYNNLVDIDAAISLVEEFDNEIFFAILKHTNACGAATGKTVHEAYLKAFEADTVSAFGGVLGTNYRVDLPAAEEIHKLFFEVIVASSYDEDALELLKSKKNRIILLQKEKLNGDKIIKSLLNGIIEQDKDLKTDKREDLKQVTKRQVTGEEVDALLFASKVCKHTKSNTIVLARNGLLIASGVGQTSRVDALNQAIKKAESFGLSLKGAVMASDAFFPFPDCVEIAEKAGIQAVIQPGGSVRDKDSIDYCDAHGMAMVFTGYRHFKH
ncbi:MAG: bifunctional phosphoribosylaminoimidazolecarboxamide formyltransferase/IMP cyclohydrolase [Cyclobacteriaceae bacterium]|nr:bifunctional phosphoribosylaminoimidazolecarboxamide formyltransferase/IMP cyclohydrolase [Cyclobacteriaceae bacterium]